MVYGQMSGCYSWYSALDSTKWMLNLSTLLSSACTVVDNLTVRKRPVLVHCSDGWDRTPQLVSLSELILDPYYRTFKVRRSNCNLYAREPWGIYTSGSVCEPISVPPATFPVYKIVMSLQLVSSYLIYALFYFPECGKLSSTWHTS